jgi:hypothetical protein
MSEEQKQPKQTDAVLGGTTQPFRGAVLGGIEGLRKRLKSPYQQERLVALEQIASYGDLGLQVSQEPDVIEKIQITHWIKSIEIKLKNCTTKIQDENSTPSLSDFFDTQYQEEFIEQLEKQGIIDNTLIYLKEIIDYVFQDNESIQELLNYIYQTIPKFKDQYQASGLRAFYIYLVEDVYTRNTCDQILALQRVKAYDLGLKLTFQQALELVKSFDIRYAQAWQAWSDDEFCFDLAYVLESEADTFYDLLKCTRAQCFLTHYDVEVEVLIDHKWWYPPATLTENYQLFYLFKIYTIAHEWLIDCLKTSCKLSESVKQQIQETLFLPAKNK